MSYTITPENPLEQSIGNPMSQQSENKPGINFKVADWLVEPDTLRMVRGEIEVKLEPKVMQVLTFLAQHPGQVISRQQIEETVWQGMIVGYDSLGSTIIKLRKAFNDDPRNPAIIQTIPKKGYRIIAPVTHSDIEHGSSADNNDIKAIKNPPQYPLPLFIATTVLVIGIALFFIFNSSTSSPDKAANSDAFQPTIAVLPFKNLSNDTEQEYFSDGITADLITDLSNIDSIAVISRNSVFAFKNADAGVDEIKNNLGVDYIIEGDVRKNNNKIRISARLFKTTDGVHIWADRYDAELSDVFAIQDRVVEDIVSSLALKLTKTEKERIIQKYTNSITAYDEFLQGWQYFWHYTLEGNVQAREYYLKAIELDPNFARAYANLAVTYAFDYMNGWSDNPEKTLEYADDAINKSAALNEDLPQVQWAIGIVNTYRRDYQTAIKAVEKSIRLSPNFADGYGLLATVLNYSGTPDKALPAIQKAMRLNPRHPFIYKMIAGQVYFNLREYELAAINLKLALERNPSAQEVRLWLAATLAYLGKQADASWQLENIQNSGVELSADYIEQSIPLKDPALRKHLLDGLISAGLKLD